MKRKGLGIGKGKGYYNLATYDPYIHSLSARGVKTTMLNAKVEVPKWVILNTRYGEPPKSLNAKGKTSVPDFVDEVFLTEQQVKLLKRRLNDNKITYDQIFKNEKTFLLTPEQTIKGYNYLIDKWKTPRGVERLSNPFGYREENILENFDHFELVDFFDDVNYYQAKAGIKNYVPIYKVVAKDGSSFTYYIRSGVPQIIG